MLPEGQLLSVATHTAPTGRSSQAIHLPLCAQHAARDQQLDQRATRNQLMMQARQVLHARQDLHAQQDPQHVRRIRHVLHARQDLHAQHRPTRTTQPTRTTRPDKTNRPRRDRGNNTNTNTNTNYNDNSSGTNYNNNSGTGNYNDNSGTGNYNDNSGSGNYNNNGNGNNAIMPVQVDVGELFSLAGTGTLSVEDAQGNALSGVLLSLNGNMLRKLFLTRELSDHYLILRSRYSTQRVPVTGKASSIIWTLEQEGARVKLDIEGGLLPDHVSAHVALKLHLVTVSGVKLTSTARTSSLALRDGNGSVTFVLQGNDTSLNFNNGCYRWVVETLSFDRAMFGEEFGGRCQ